MPQQREQCNSLVRQSACVKPNAAMIKLDGMTTWQSFTKYQKSGF